MANDKPAPAAKPAPTPTLADLGFQSATGIVKPRLIVNIEALEKQGKTHLALTAPGPIGYYNLDTGDEGVVDKFVSTGKQVYVHDIPVTTTQDDAKAAWDKFETSFRGALAHPQLRSLVWDTGTEIWELLRMARFGKLSQISPQHYGPVNAEMRRLIRAAFDSDKNLILLHKMKALYIENRRTNKYERTGFSDIGFLVQVNCVARRGDAWEDADGVLHTGDFTLEIRDCRQNPDLQGMVLEGPMCSFPVLASLVLPSTDPSDWE